MNLLDSILSVFTKVFGSKSERDLKKIRPFVGQIKSFEASLKTLSDEQLKEKTQEFKRKIQEATADIAADIDAVKKQLSSTDETLTFDKRKELADELEALDKEYLESVERSGAGGLELPTVQFYSKLSYPFSIPIVIIIGLCLASVRRKGGKGVYLAIGLGVSFLYLTTMKLFEPLGINGVLSPLYAATIPHLLFLFASIILMIKTKK